MFRQTKRRLATRRNFHSAGSEPLDESTSEEERKFYDSIYATKLHFYEYPPRGEITLEQFETWAIDRLKILLEIQSCVSRNKSLRDMESILKPQLQKLFSSSADGSLDSRKKDYYSHFILRLCFCRSKELRENFVRAETMLFKIRFNMLTSAEQLKVVQSLHLPMLQFISSEEKAKLATPLYQTISPLLQLQLNIQDEQQRRLYFQQERFIKLPFESVINLVGSRQVYLRDGLVYLPQFQQLDLITAEFSKNLTSALVKTFQYLPRLNEDDRLVPILDNLASGYTIADFDTYDPLSSKDGGDASDINAESVWTEEIAQHYPLSVRYLMEGLKKNHHLRYFGRQQLCFFLKGIGLTADEALKFWSRAFTEGGHMTIEKFNKEYRYNFRHNYGLEGTRINYKPWDCRTILSKPRPGRGDYHGCPFRDWSPEKLTSELSKMKLTPAQITSVLDSCQKGEYTIANSKVFEFTHGYKGADIEIDEQKHIAHPNLYFERSRQWLRKRREAEKAVSSKV